MDFQKSISDEVTTCYEDVNFDVKVPSHHCSVSDSALLTSEELSDFLWAASGHEITILIPALLLLTIFVYEIPYLSTTVTESWRVNTSYMFMVK
jgi:hypothetical protein